MAKGLDKQKNDKKKGKTLKEKRAAKKEKKKQFFVEDYYYLVDLGPSLKSILKNNIIPVTELTKAKIENIFKRKLSILSLSFQSII